MFGIGGLTGLPLGLAASDIPLHDTYYVVGHFHYIVAPGTLFALFAGIYYWFPKVTGRMMNDTLGQLHFWGSLIGMNGMFLPMFIQGLAGVNRRLVRRRPDATRTRAAIARSYSGQWWAAVLLGAVQLVLHRQSRLESARAARGRATIPWRSHDARVDDDVAAAARQLRDAPIVHRGPYDYSVPGAAADFRRMQSPSA